MTVEEANISLESRKIIAFLHICRIYWEEKLTLFAKLIWNAAEAIRYILVYSYKASY